MGDALKRVGRLASQMRFIYGNPNRSKLEKVILADLLKAANEEARENLGAKKATLQLDETIVGVTVYGNRAALIHAFSEILLNGYQASATNPSIMIKVLSRDEASATSMVPITIEDAGPGFTKDSAGQALTPFYTTKTAGVGLGLSAAQRIIEDHGGRMEIPTTYVGKQGVVRVDLPQDMPQE